MGDNYGGITYQYATIETAAGNIDSFIQFMNSELADIESKLRPLETNWTSEAQTAYLACKMKWRNNAEQIVTVLGQLKLALSGAGSRMQEADLKAKGGFNI